MLIGHLPAGYFLTKSILKKLKISLNNPLGKWLFLMGLTAAVLPDFDLAYWMLFDEYGTGSHRFYYTNYPVIYLIILGFFVILYLLLRKKWLKYGIIVVFANIFLHFLLDTVFVGIKWFWPFYDHLIGIYNVNFTGGLLVENYFHHWWWFVEIALWILAVISIIISAKKGEFN